MSHSNSLIHTHTHTHVHSPTPSLTHLVVLPSVYGSSGHTLSAAAAAVEGADCNAVRGVQCEVVREVVDVNGIEGAPLMREATPDYLKGLHLHQRVSE